LRPPAGDARLWHQGHPQDQGDERQAGGHVADRAVTLRGKLRHRRERDQRANVKPTPNAAPIRAMPRLRCSGGVQSAITAAAVEIVAPAMPAPMRATNISATASVACAGSMVAA